MQQCPDCRDHVFEIGIVARDPALQFGELCRDDGVSAGQFTESNKCADDEHTHFDGPPAVQNGGCHDGAVFSEYQRRIATSSVRRS